MRISDWSSDVCSSDLRRHMPLDRQFAGMVRQAVDRAGKPRVFGHVDEQIVDRHRADRRQHRLAVVGGKGQVAHHISQRSEEHTSELQSLMRISYAVFCLKKKKKHTSTLNTCVSKSVNNIHNYYKNFII